MRSLGAFRSGEFRRRLAEARGRLFRTAYAWTHNRALAEDLVQETVAKALNKAGQLREAGAMEAWLFRIMANCWHDVLRRNPAMEPLDECDVTSHDTPETVNTRMQLIKQVRAAVAKLPTSFRETVTLVDIEGFSYAETAHILDVPMGTVMSRLSRGRNRLRRLLAPQLGWRLTEERSASVRRIK